MGTSVNEDGCGIHWPSSWAWRETGRVEEENGSWKEKSHELHRKQEIGWDLERCGWILGVSWDESLPWGWKGNRFFHNDGKTEDDQMQTGSRRLCRVDKVKSK